MTQENHQSTVEIGKRNLNAANHWERLDLENLKFEKPTVLCFSGNMTIENEEANGLAKIVENYLGLMFTPKKNYHLFDHVDIMGVKYAQVSKDTGCLNESAVEQIANAILSLLTDDMGQRLNLEQAKQNMSRITFFTYCAGNRELVKVIGVLNSKLASIGYERDEIIAINRASLEISYAPENLICNYIPSVRVISQNDDIVGLMHLDKFENGGVITYDQVSKLNGVHLHQDMPGKFYGRANKYATAESLQIISSGLVNSFFDSTNPERKINEHNLGITARDHNWNLQPTIIDKVPHRSYNADCVSQMISWSLCKGVENSLQNFQADKYIPNNYLHELSDDFKSIIKSYEHKKLSKNVLRESVFNKNKFDLMRETKKATLAESIKIDVSPEVVARELNNAKKFKEVMIICEKYDYQHTDAIVSQLKFLTDEQKLILRIAQENKSLPQVDFHVLYQQCTAELEQCDKSFPSVLKIMDRCDYQVSDLLPRMNYLTNGQKATLVDLYKIKKQALEMRNKHKMQYVPVPTFEEMVDTLNNANSLEDAIAYLKKNDFLGVEYLLPEVQVLTSTEKNSILAMAGKQTQQTSQELGIEL
ncbi:MAG: hypothetical protein IKT33_00715 [Clostridia bacterium]|nr:hypothetical protein [Clostridia bacterium]